MYFDELVRGAEADAAALARTSCRIGCLLQSDTTLAEQVTHEGTFSDRVYDYANFDKLLGETQTTTACAMLEGRPVGHSPTLSRYMYYDLVLKYWRASAPRRS